MHRAVEIASWMVSGKDRLLNYRTGHYLEREGDRYYAQQRYYQPSLGRFNRIDPWEGSPRNPITLNKYLYGNGNPLAYIDPDGRIALLEDWKAWAAQAGADSLAYAESFQGASAEAAWYAKPGLAIGWGLSGAAYLTAGATEGVISGANTGANALVIGVDWTGEQLGTTTPLAPLAAEGRAEIEQMVEAIGPRIDNVRADPAGALVDAAKTEVTQRISRVQRAMAGDSRAVFDLVSSLDPRRALRSTGIDAPRMTQQAQPVRMVEGADGGVAGQHLGLGTELA